MGFFTKKRELTWKETTPRSQMYELARLKNMWEGANTSCDRAKKQLDAMVSAIRARLPRDSISSFNWIANNYVEVKAAKAQREKANVEQYEAYREYAGYAEGLKKAHRAQKHRNMIKRARKLRRMIMKQVNARSVYWNQVSPIVRVLVGAWTDVGYPDVKLDHPSELRRLLDARDMLRLRLLDLPEEKRIEGALSEVDVSGVRPRLEASLKAVLARIDDVFFALEALPDLLKSLNASMGASKAAAVAGRHCEDEKRTEIQEALTNLVTEIEKVLGPSRRRSGSRMSHLDDDLAERIEAGEFGGTLLTTGEFAALAEVDAVALFRSFHPIETPEEREFAQKRPEDAEAIRRAELAAEHGRS